MHVFVWMCFVCVSMPMYIFRGHIFQLTESLFPNTRDRTRAPCGAQSPNHWTAREVHVHMYFCIMSTHVLSCSYVCVLCTCSQMCVCVGEGGSSAPGVPKTQASYLGTWGLRLLAHAQTHAQIQAATTRGIIVTAGISCCFTK